MKKTLSILSSVLLVFILMSISYTTNSKAEISANLVTNPSFEGATWQVDASNANFEGWEISRTPDNGIIKTWVETANVHTGSKAFHWRTEAPNTTSMSLNYKLNFSKKIPIDENKYIEAGLWTFVIEGATTDDISIHFYFENGSSVRVRGQNKLGAWAMNNWARVSYVWYPSSLGNGEGYIPKGAKYARLHVVANWLQSGVRERIDDDAFVKQYDHMPSWAERLEKNLTNIRLVADYNKLQGTSALSYSAHPAIWDEEFRSGGRDGLFWDILKSFSFSKMRFQAGLLFDSNGWVGSPICLYWNKTTNSCDENNVQFEDWDIKRNSDNGFIKTWAETINTRSGSKALHFYVQAPSAPSPTELSISYYSDYFSIDESKYYEAGFWSYPIQGSRGYDVSIYFYDENKNQLGRIHGQDVSGSFLQGTWKKASSLFYPSFLGNGNGYIPKGAKYAKLNIFINWHTAGIKEAIDDDAFVRKFSSKPSAADRQLDVTNNLIPNPSFDGGTSVYDWDILDQMIEAVHIVGEEPMISLPVGTWSNANYMPDGMPLNESIFVDGGVYYKGYYPTLDAYCKLVKAVVKHTNIEKGYNVRYWEIGNEPYVEENEAVIMAYIDLFNTAEKCMHEIDPTVLVGCDRSNYRYFMDNYFIKYAKNVGFLDFHNYDTGGTCMYPYNSTNVNNEYYPPNDKNGWLKDVTIMSNVNKLGSEKRYSPKELKDFWKNSRGQDLEVIATELNMNSAFRNGSDPRMNNLLGATWYAAKVKAYILDGGASVLNYFVIASWNTEQPTAKYGGFGFGMMNSSYPYNPYAPYWTNYFLTKYIPEGSLIYNSTSSESDTVDILAVDPGRSGGFGGSAGSKNILLINKANETVSFTLPILGFTMKNANLYLLDGTTYIQKYEPSLDKTVIYKSSINTIQLPKNNVQSFTFNGYTVAILEAFPDTAAPHLASVSSGLDLESATWDQSQNRYYAKADCSGANEMKVHSDTKPSAVKVGGTVVNYDDSLSAFPSWRYDAANKLITIKFSC